MARNKAGGIRLESDLSPFVLSKWESLGYCVHGEVAVFGTSLFIDHVAHLGPCSAPTKVVAIEMKKGASASLRKQVLKVDRLHVADEIWGCIATTEPKQETLIKWACSGVWDQAGLLSFSDSGAATLFIAPESCKGYRRKLRKDRLLLVPENRRITAGHASGVQDYITHWKLIRAKVLAFAQAHDAPWCIKDLPDIPETRPYRRKNAAILSAIKDLIEVQDALIMTAPKGRTRYYTRKKTTME